MALQIRSLLTCLVLASYCLGAFGSTRELQATNVITHISIPYNRTLVGGDPLGQLSLSDPRLQRTVEGLTPEQVSTRQTTCRVADLPIIAYDVRRLVAVIDAFKRWFTSNS